MKTFVLAIFVASAAFGLASAFECSDEIMDFVRAKGACIKDAPSEGCAVLETTDEYFTELVIIISGLVK